MHGGSGGSRHVYYSVADSGPVCGGGTYIHVHTHTHTYTISAHGSSAAVILCYRKVAT